MTTKKRARDSLSFIVEAGNALAGAFEEAAIYSALARATVGHFADWCFVTLANGDRFETVAIEHQDESYVRFIAQYRDRYPAAPGRCLQRRRLPRRTAAALRRDHARTVKAGAVDDEHLKLLEFLQMHSVMVLPLVAPSAEPYGALTMVSAESGRLFNVTDLNVGMEIARRAAAAIANVRMLETERRTAENSAPADDQLLFETSEPWATMERVAQIIAHEVADACAILRLRDDTVRTEIIVHRDESDE